MIQSSTHNNKMMKATTMNIRLSPITERREKLLPCKQYRSRTGGACSMGIKRQLDSLRIDSVAYKNSKHRHQRVVRRISPRKTPLPRQRACLHLHSTECYIPRDSDYSNQNQLWRFPSSGREPETKFKFLEEMKHKPLKSKEEMSKCQKFKALGDMSEMAYKICVTQEKRIEDGDRKNETSPDGFQILQSQRHLPPKPCMLSPLERKDNKTDRITTKNPTIRFDTQYEPCRKYDRFDISRRNSSHRSNVCVV